MKLIARVLRKIRKVWPRQRLLTQYIEHHEIQKPIFIVGLNNSGTSILWRGLKNCYGLSGPSNEAQACADVPASLKYPKGLMPESSRIWAAPEYISYYYLSSNHWDETRGKNVKAFYSTYTTVSERMIDKNPISTLKMRFLQSIFPDAHFIGIVRNGLAVCEGVMRMRRRRDLPEGKVIPVEFNYNLAERAAQHWLFGNLCMLHDAYYLKNFMLVKYEDLILQPDKIFPKIGEFCEIESEFKLNLHIPGGAGSNESFDSFDQSRNQIQIENLEDEERDAITDIISPMMHRLSYSI